VTWATPALLPLRDSTGAPLAESSGIGVLLQAASRALSKAGIMSFFMVFSVRKFKISESYCK
jgi:hypothetical protein